jgi:hypothetical protein
MEEDTEDFEIPPCLVSRSPWLRGWSGSGSGSGYGSAAMDGTAGPLGLGESRGKWIAGERPSW